MKLSVGGMPHTLRKLFVRRSRCELRIGHQAYADLLKSAGRPTLLLFDDAIVHTDDARREGIKRALAEAAKRYQILMLTCHPSHWNDLGVKQRHLADLKAAFLITALVLNFL